MSPRNRRTPLGRRFVCRCAWCELLGRIEEMQVELQALALAAVALMIGLVVALLVYVTTS